MRWSNVFIPTLRETPADADVVSHQLMLRAGLIRQLAAGVYSYLPLAWRVLLKITAIVREEMNGIGGQEFHLPALHPADVWKESGRWDVMGETMFRLTDRKGAPMCLGMTHEDALFTFLDAHILMKLEAPLDPFSPKNLLGLERLADSEGDRNTAAGRRNDAAMRQRCGHLSAPAKQPTQPHAEEFGNTVILQRQRHLHEVVRMHAYGQGKMSRA